MKGPIASLFLCALLAGWFAPGLSTDVSDEGAEPDEAQIAAALSARPDAAKARAAWLSGQTVLRREADGHFYADVMVEGRPIRFLVDTGASTIALTGQDAMDLGFTWSDDALQHVGRGAGGAVEGIPVRIDRVELGGVEARGISGVVIPEGLDVSLLGQSFLSQFPNMEIVGDEMRLGG